MSLERFSEAIVTNADWLKLFKNNSRKSRNASIDPTCILTFKDLSLSTGQAHGPYPIGDRTADCFQKQMRRPFADTNGVVFSHNLIRFYSGFSGQTLRSNRCVSACAST